MSKKVLNNFDWIHGRHAVLNYVRFNSDFIKEIAVNDDSDVVEIKSLIQKPDFQIKKRPKSFFERFPKGHQHMACLCKINLFRGDLKTFINENKSDNLTIAILDQCTDPQNFGACIRSALAFNINAIIIPKDRSVSLTPTVYKVAAGGVSQLDLFTVTNVSKTLEYLKSHGFWVYGSCERAKKSIDQIDFSDKSVLVFGSESKGIRDIVRKEVDEIFTIKTNPNFPSLNLAMASSITFFYCNLKN